MNFKDLKVRTKLLLGFGTLTLFIAFGGLFSLQTMGRIQAKTVEIETSWMPSVHLLGKLAQSSALLRLWNVRFAIAAGPEEKKLMEDWIRSEQEELKKYISNYALLIASEEEQRLFESFKEKREKLLQANEEQLYPLIRAGDTAGAIKFIEETGPRFKEISDQLDQLIEVNNKGAHAAAEVSQLLYARSQKTTVALIGFAVLLALGITFFLTRAITGALYSLISVAGMVAKGDLTPKIDTSRNDEIGQLAKAFRTMVEGLQNVVKQVLLTAERVSSSSQQLSSSAEEMNATTQEVSSTVQQIAQGAEGTARQVEETSKTMEQMSASVGQVATGAQQAASASVQANQTAQRGSESSKEAVIKMNKIFQSVTNSAGVVKKLGERSEQISEIVNVITDIADQTNLLALNAAIEAARAGEAGRGFAVVAEEVRKLAEGSAKAADQIARLIKEIQRETTEAVAAIETGSKEVTEGREVITKSGEAFGEIAKAVENTASMVEQISAATEQMAAGTKQVVKSVDDIASTAEEAASATEETSASTEEMTAAMEELTASAQELSEMAIELRKLVGRFKLSDGTYEAPVQTPQYAEAKPPAPQLPKLERPHLSHPLAERREKLAPIITLRKGPNGSRKHGFGKEG